MTRLRFGSFAALLALVTTTAVVAWSPRAEPQSQPMTAAQSSASAESTAVTTTAERPVEQPAAMPQPGAAAQPADATAASRTATRSTRTARPLREQAGAEIRAFWVDAFHDGFKTPQQVDKLLADVRAANANAVVVQVRRRGDAYFNNTIEPRTEDPALARGFDALQDLIDKAHASEPRIQVHAWLATLPVWRGRDTTPRDPSHVFNVHGAAAPASENWLSASFNGDYFDGSNYSLDPGHPAALEYTVNVYAHVVRNYDVDGVHSDYIRYADTMWGYNPTSLARFQASTGRFDRPEPTDPAWAAWRREQITALERRIYLTVGAIKPHVVVSAAVIPWGNGPTSRAEWVNSAAWKRVYQDWRGWLEEGIIDVAFPMVYFREAEARQRGWFDQWAEFAKDNQYGRAIVLGPGTYLNSIPDNLEQIRRATSLSAQGNRVAGVSFYSYAVTSSEPNDRIGDFAQALRRGPFEQTARTPELPWKVAPAGGHLLGTIRDVLGRPVDGTRVTLSGPKAANGLTDGGGFYGFVDLPPGGYTATATVGGQPFTWSVEIAPGQVTVHTYAPAGMAAVR